MATSPGPNVQGRKGGALAAAVGVAAAIVAAPYTVSAEEFLIPSAVAPVDPAPLAVFPSRPSQPPRPFPAATLRAREMDDLVKLTLEGREAYNRLADELVANGMPRYLKPHKFAVRCLVAAAPESEVDAATMHTWTEVWYAGDRLRYIGSSRKDRVPELRKQIVYEAQTKDTWPHDNVDQTCIDLAQIAKAGLQDVDQIYAKQGDAAETP